MQKEIKFRAWDTKNKEWLTQVPCLEYLLDDSDAPVSHHDVDMESGLYFYPLHPMGPTFNGRVIYQQYTSLKDKNGKEIFEGDILEVCGWRGSKGVVEVKFMESEASDDAGVNTIGFRKFDEYGLPMIIGNIFENPELLKS